MMLEKLQRAYHTLQSNFAPVYLDGSNKLRAYLFFIYGKSQHPEKKGGQKVVLTQSKNKFKDCNPCSS